jgi:hypothetical protein
MGTCCGGTKIKYEHNGKTHMIGLKQAATIDRFCKGASARIKTNRLKVELAKSIAGTYFFIFTFILVRN